MFSLMYVDVANVSAVCFITSDSPATIGAPQATETFHGTDDSRQSTGGILSNFNHNSTASKDFTRRGRGPPLFQDGYIAMIFLNDIIRWVFLPTAHWALQWVKLRGTVTK